MELIDVAMKSLATIVLLGIFAISSSNLKGWILLLILFWLYY